MNAPIQYKTINGFKLLADPAREACFTVVQTDDEMVNPIDSWLPEAQRERLHRHMNNEIGSLEIAAQTLADFPDAPWELRLALARQTYDETRHVSGLYRRLRELGGFKGEFPIANFEWSVTIMQDSIVARLAIQNRTFEAGEMDLLGGLRKHWRSIGDARTADLLETILADEVNHVRFANRWIKRLVREDRRLLLKIAQAMHFLSAANAALSGPVDGKISSMAINAEKHTRLGINVGDRRIAEFSDEEINEILRQSGMRSLAELAAEVSTDELR